MRWSSVLLPFTLLSAGVLAAAEKASNRFLDFHKQALGSAPIKLDDAQYKDITAVPRDYSVAVLLTAMDDRFACQMCREFGPEWDLLSKSWTKGDKAGESGVIFSVLDFNNGRDTFMSLGLQTAPVLLFFQPTTGEFAVSEPAPLRFDFTSGKPTAESVREWITRHTPGRFHPEVKRPFPWFKWLVGITIVLGVFSAMYLAWGVIEAVVTNRKIWSIVSVIAILVFTAGHMFNNIRGVPYAGHDGRGHISYFAGGFQSQFQIESQIVAGIYGFLALTAIFFADRIPRISDPKAQFAVAIAAVVANVVVYSLLMNIFRIKNGGYPFAIPPFL